MTAPRKPQDRKPKLDTSGVFSFELDGVTHELPSVAPLFSKISARVVRDSLRDDSGEIALVFALLDAVEGHDEACDALLDQPMEKMADIAGAWIKNSKGSGADLGE